MKLSKIAIVKTFLSMRRRSLCGSNDTKFILTGTDEMRVQIESTVAVSPPIGEAWECGFRGKYKVQGFYK